jgi:NAD+ kinase
VGRPIKKTKGLRILKIMKIGIYSNIQRDKDLSATKRFIGMLKKDGADFLVADFPELNGGRAVSKEDLADLCGLVVVFGGDGTILNVVKQAAKRRVPVLGVNMGNMGFLTEVGEGRLKEVAAAIMSRDYTTESRLMIDAEVVNKASDKQNFECKCKNNTALNLENIENKASVDGQNIENKTVYTALNEIFLKETAFKMARFRLSVDGFLADNYHADGVLVSTPTGSTAYSLSVGGPILAPNVGALIVNPVNAHSLHSRPIVVSDMSVIEVETPKEGDLQIIADGVCAAKAGCGEVVRIRKSEHSAVFIKLNSESFYTKLLHKFNKNMP